MIYLQIIETIDHLEGQGATHIIYKWIHVQYKHYIQINTMRGQEESIKKKIQNTIGGEWTKKRSTSKLSNFSTDLQPALFYLVTVAALHASCSARFHLLSWSWYVLWLEAFWPITSSKNSYLLRNLSFLSQFIFWKPATISQAYMIWGHNFPGISGRDPAPEGEMDSNGCSRGRHRRWCRSEGGLWSGGHSEEGEKWVGWC